jgi:hypothetical protein
MVSMREVYAEIDEVKMIMVITNLVENAVKYNRDHGKVRVTINADPYNFYISVEDTGVVIPQDSLDKIYERFYRVDKSRSREVGGTGLGLSITKSIILQHHGAIDVQSILGEGTKFTVTIPLTYVAHPVELRRQSDRRRLNRKRKASSSTAVHRLEGTEAAAVRRADGAGTAGTRKASGTAKKAAGSGSAAPRKKAGSANAAAGANAAARKKAAGNGKKAAGSGTSAAKKRPAGSVSANGAARKRPEGSGSKAAVRKKTAGSGSTTV